MRTRRPGEANPSCRPARLSRHCNHQGFLFGALVVPIILGALAALVPRTFDDAYKNRGDFAVIDPTGLAYEALRDSFDPETLARQRRVERGGGMFGETVAESTDSAFGPLPNVRLTVLPADTDADAAKVWLNERASGSRHVALIVIDPDAVATIDPDGELGTYALYVSPGIDL